HLFVEVDTSLPWHSSRRKCVGNERLQFTAMTLNIFHTFGFQMLMATPMKAVRTLEPFIGGAHVFSNKSRDSSGAVSIEYDMTHHRLIGLGAPRPDDPSRAANDDSDEGGARAVD
ncbi:hypothetical protein WL94_22940, partial [Burkholderia cepacia]|uniref:hypothetical protein n=1 Tax=Burkholderia cepacia TaxID=292 RepID=UPI00076D5372